MISKNVTNKFIIKMQTLSSTKRLVIINLFSFEKNKKRRRRRRRRSKSDLEYFKILSGHVGQMR